MYRLIMELPFDIVALWYKDFESIEDAEETRQFLPNGFIIVQLDSIPVDSDNVIVVPFNMELENNVS